MFCTLAMQNVVQDFIFREYRLIREKCENKVPRKLEPPSPSLTQAEHSSPAVTDCPTHTPPTQPYNTHAHTYAHTHARTHTHTHTDVSGHSFLLHPSRHWALCWFRTNYELVFCYTVESQLARVQFSLPEPSPHLSVYTRAPLFMHKHPEAERALAR